MYPPTFEWKCTGLQLEDAWYIECRFCLILWQYFFCCWNLTCIDAWVQIHRIGNPPCMPGVLWLCKELSRGCTALMLWWFGSVDWVGLVTWASNWGTTCREATSRESRTKGKTTVCQVRQNLQKMLLSLLQIVSKINFFWIQVAFLQKVPFETGSS